MNALVRIGGRRNDSWPIDLEELPALLAVVDDQLLPVELRVGQGGASLAVRMSDLVCRRNGQCLVLAGPESSLRVDLAHLHAARAVSRSAGKGRCLSLELIGVDGRAALTITGPCQGLEHGGDIWCLLLEALAEEEACGAP